MPRLDPARRIDFVQSSGASVPSGVSQQLQTVSRHSNMPMEVAASVFVLYGQTASRTVSPAIPTATVTTRKSGGCVFALVHAGSKYPAPTGMFQNL
jgi:hypothetical protein